MKRTALFAALAVIAAASVGPANAAGGPGGNGAAAHAGGNRMTQVVNTITAEEAADLLWMYEEEKMARDVYLNLYDRWQAREFKNIARSEQRHFDSLGRKITLFGLTDPALPLVGQFANTEIQALYTRLISAGLLSYLDALKVGAEIEDMDIRDLMAAIEATTNAALKLNYGHLLEGSKNHLRTFVARLEALGFEYVPQYIDPVLYDAIIGQ